MSCGFCHLAMESRKTGPLLQKEDTAAHENCLLFSSGLVTQSTPEGDDLAGFSVEGVKKEINRGRKLYCFKCKKSGATVGCEVKKCKRSYHFLCALKDNAKKEEDMDRGLFRIYCEIHKSKIPEDTIDDKSDAESDQTEESESDTDNSSDECTKKTPKRKRSPPAKRIYFKKSRKRTSSPRIVISKKNPADGDKSDDTLIESEDAEIPCSSGINSPKKTEKRTLMKSPSKNSIGAISPRLKVVRIDADLVSKGKNMNESEDEQLATDTDKNGACDTGVSDASTNVDSHDEKEDEEASESILMPINIESVSLRRSVYSGNPAEFWKTCREARCVEKLFSKIQTTVSNVSQKIVMHAASDHDYKFAMDILIASGLLPEVISDNNKDLKEKLKELEAEIDSLLKAQVAMQELKEITKNIQN
ncbi:uncharacterized protein LOC117406568 isoform X1 [Acipenser ruthenus]|uniref:uncharacterized protein LOC117406568 isoform X1 n=1 Tax=Acipenser ruthenus TaxID=7906 RepID=UPI00274167F6|nr:uncharacterized protein LOC117406568 isoform X1 [Acipenser ruthenus]XP_058885161.1 uncharacterized protein LOC117406568 isoform X1 [Acipenser ruthenus]